MPTGQKHEHAYYLVLVICHQTNGERKFVDVNFLSNISLKQGWAYHQEAKKLPGVILLWAALHVLEFTAIFPAWKKISEKQKLRIYLIKNSSSCCWP